MKMKVIGMLAAFTLAASAAAAQELPRKVLLNQVDEADLMALTENGEAAKKPEICNCTEMCIRDRPGISVPS